MCYRCSDYRFKPASWHDYVQQQLVGKKKKKTTLQFNGLNTLQKREISWSQGGVDWLQICLSTLRIFFIHMSPSRKHVWLWSLPEDILHRCRKQREVQMLNITSAAIFSPTYANVVIYKDSHQIPTRRGRIHRSWSALCAPIFFHTCNYPAVFASHCIVSRNRQNYAKSLRVTLIFYLANLDLSF